MDRRRCSLKAHPSARPFGEILLEGTSKLTRQALDQIRANRKMAFIDDVAERLRDYETSTGVELPHKSHLLVAHKRHG
jgi:hypothetical protein